MGAEATACRLPAPALPTRSPCPTLGRPDAARRSTAALNVPPLPPVPPVPLRHDGTDHLLAQGFAYGSVGGASTFRGVQTARAGFRGLVCCAVPFKPVVERACKARASLPHPASTVGQAALRSDIRAVVVPAQSRDRGSIQSYREKPSVRGTASRSLCIARTSIGCVLCHGSRWTRTSFFSVSADMFTRAGTTLPCGGPWAWRLAAPRGRRAAREGATQVDGGTRATAGLPFHYTRFRYCADTILTKSTSDVPLRRRVSHTGAQLWPLRRKNSTVPDTNRPAPMRRTGDGKSLNLAFDGKTRRSKQGPALCAYWLLGRGSERGQHGALCRARPALGASAPAPGSATKSPPTAH